MRSFSYVRSMLLALAVVFPAITSAGAFEEKKFDPASFKAAQDSNKSILVDIWASWCPVCKKRHQVLAALAKKPEYAELVDQPRG
jgi:thioredoxin 1